MAKSQSEVLKCIFQESADSKKTKSRSELVRGKTQSRVTLSRASSRGRLRGGETQKEEEGGARLIYRAGSDLKRTTSNLRLQRQNSQNLTSSHINKVQRSSDQERSCLERSNSSNNVGRERLARSDSHVQHQRGISRDDSRQNLGRENKLLRGNSDYKLLREFSVGQLQRGKSQTGFLRSSSSHSLSRGNSFQLPRQASSSQLKTLNRALSRGKIVTELCTRQNSS